MLATHVLVAASQAGGASAGARGVVGLAVGALSAWRGYVRAERVERETGRRPWGWSPTTWSVLCFFSLLLGRLCLRAAADRATRARRPVPHPSPPAAGAASIPFPTPAPGTAHPTRPLSATILPGQ